MDNLENRSAHGTRTAAPAELRDIGAAAVRTFHASYRPDHARVDRTTGGRICSVREQPAATAQLSGGQALRVAIARALAGRV